MTEFPRRKVRFWRFCLSLCAALALSVPASYADDRFATPQVSSARWHTLLLRDDGSVWACSAGFGIDDAGITDPDPLLGGAPWPLQVLPPGTATRVSAGVSLSYAGVLGVGSNFYGQLGVGPEDPATGRVTGRQDHYMYNPPVTGRPVAGHEFSFYVANGQVMAAGRNDLGQLGNGSAADGPNPVFAPVVTAYGTPLENVRSVAAGSAFGVAVTRDGEVWTWGANNYGELGDGTLDNRAYAAPVAGLPKIIAVSASTGRFLPPPLEESPVHDHVLALAADGTVWAWGENRDGATGNGTEGVVVTDPVTVSDPVTLPVQVLVGVGRPLKRVKAIATGGTHSLALRHDGTVWAWGYNGTGQLGSGTYGEGANSYATAVPGLRRIRSIAAGAASSFAVDNRGRVWSWGFGFNKSLCLGPRAHDDGFNPANFVVSPTRIRNRDGTYFNLRVKGNRSRRDRD